MLYIYLGTEYDLTGKIAAVRYFTAPDVGKQWIDAGPVMIEEKKRYPLRFVSTTAIPVCETVEEANL